MRFRRAVWITVALLAAGLKIARLHDRPAELALSVWIDTVLWGLFGLTWELAAARLGRSMPPGARALSGLGGRLVDVVCAGLLWFSLGLVFAHTWFFDAAVERRLTVFDVTL